MKKKIIRNFYLNKKKNYWENKNGIVVYRFYANHFECLELENKLNKELK